MEYAIAIAVLCFAGCSVWNCYEFYRLRQQREQHDLMGHLITSILQKMEARQDALAANDRAIAKTFEAVESRINKGPGA